MFEATSNYKTISEIYKMFEDESLIIDDTYQRRAVWVEKDNVRLIETIMLNMIVPELFFWKCDIDPETGAGITHIVDGQQRIKAISDFINNKFALKSEIFLNKKDLDKNPPIYANSFFKDFSIDLKKYFWNFRLTIIEIDPKVSRDDIKHMFRRLNLTNYSLNEQEKRNSLSGDFASLARELSELDIWSKYKLFNNSDIRRMKDVEFCAILILLCRQGIIDQTNQEALNNAYLDLEVYKDKDSDKTKINTAISILEDFLTGSDEIHKFLKRKVQLYTIFSIIFYMLRENISMSDTLKELLKDFIQVYVHFNNDDVELENQLNDNEKIIFDWLKKYKLASSEGLNKLTNRMIRNNVMKDFLFSLTPELSCARKTLYTKMATHPSTTNAEDDKDGLFDDVDDVDN